MARGLTSPESCIAEYLEINYRRGVKEHTRDTIKWIVEDATRILRQNNLEAHPKKIGEREIGFLLREKEKYQPATKNWYFKSLNKYLRYYDNQVIRDLKLDFGVDTRPHVSWLEPDEVIKLCQCKMSPLEEITIHFGLFMGMRISEVCAIRTSDIHVSDKPGQSYIEIAHGKGRGLGKRRLIPFFPTTRVIIDRWLEVRSEYVKKARAHNWGWIDPGNLLLYILYDGKQVGAYNPRSHSLDRMTIHRVRQRLNMDFTMHTLRRTFAREIQHSGNSIETLATMLGHSTTSVTLQYLGNDMDAMNKAQENRYRDLKSRIPDDGGEEK